MAREVTPKELMLEAASTESIPRILELSQHESPEVKKRPVLQRDLSHTSQLLHCRFGLQRSNNYALAGSKKTLICFGTAFLVCSPVRVPSYMAHKCRGCVPSQNCFLHG
jgi:hypothetical protein